MKLKVVHVAFGLLEGAGGPRHGKLQAAVDPRPVVPNLKDPHLEPQLGVHPDVHVVEALARLPRVRLRDAVLRHDLRALERRGERRRALPPLVEGGQRGVAEAEAVVGRPRLQVVVVDADPLVGVADAHGEGEVVAQTAGAGGVVELGEGGVVDVSLDVVGAEDEPEDEDDDAEGDDDGDDELDEVAEEAEGAAAAAAGATADAAVGVSRRDRGAVVGPVQVGLLRLGHGKRD